MSGPERCALWTVTEQPISDLALVILLFVLELQADFLQYISAQ